MKIILVQDPGKLGNDLLFVRVIVLSYSNIEQGGGREIFSKKKNTIYLKNEMNYRDWTIFSITFVRNLSLYTIHYTKGITLMN